MGLRGVDKQHRRTVCEVIREIADLVRDIVQCDSLLSSRLLVEPIVEKCEEAEKMCKRMARKLYEYNKEFDKGWWEDNKDWEEDLRKRLGYKENT